MSTVKLRNPLRTGPWWKRQTFSFLTPIKISGIFGLFTYPAHVTHLDAKNRLRQTVAIHDVGEIFQDAVKNLVQFLSEDGQHWLWGELPRKRLSLMGHNRSQRSSPPWPPKEPDQPRAKAEPPTHGMYATRTVWLGWSLKGRGNRRKHPTAKLKLLIHTPVWGFQIFPSVNTVINYAFQIILESVRCDCLF